MRRVGSGAVLSFQATAGKTPAVNNRRPHCNKYRLVLSGPSRSTRPGEDHVWVKMITLDLSQIWGYHLDTAV